MLLQREAEIAKRESAKLLRELQEAQEALRTLQDVSERNCWVSGLGTVLEITLMGSLTACSTDFALVQ